MYSISPFNLLAIMRMKSYYSSGSVVLSMERDTPEVQQKTNKTHMSPMEWKV